jgi:hypothetical protein
MLKGSDGPDGEGNDGPDAQVRVAHEAAGRDTCLNQSVPDHIHMWMCPAAQDKEYA